MAQEKKPICAVCGVEFEGLNLIAPATHRQSGEPCCGTHCSNRPSIRTFDPATGKFSRFYVVLGHGEEPFDASYEDGIPLYSPSFNN